MNDESLIGFLDFGESKEVLDKQAATANFKRTLGQVPLGEDRATLILTLREVCLAFAPRNAVKSEPVVAGKLKDRTATVSSEVQELLDGTVKPLLAKYIPSGEECERAAQQLIDFSRNDPASAYTICFDAQHHATRGVDIFSADSAKGRAR